MCQTRSSRAKLRGVDLALGDLVISCDVVLHPLLGDAFVICDRAGEPLTAMSALDLDHPHEIPVIAEPAKLPAGTGALLLNRIAERAPGPLRYAGPYPTPALYRALVRSFRASADNRMDIYGFSLEPYRLAEMAWPGVFGVEYPENRLWLYAIPGNEAHGQRGLADPALRPRDPR